MELTHEFAGILISVTGVLFIVLAEVVPKQIHRWHVHGIEQVEPVMISWLSRLMGFALSALGIVTMLSIA